MGKITDSTKILGVKRTPPVIYSLFFSAIYTWMSQEVSKRLVGYNPNISHLLTIYKLPGRS